MFVIWIFYLNSSNLEDSLAVRVLKWELFAMSKLLVVLTTLPRSRKRFELSEWYLVFNLCSFCNVMYSYSKSQPVSIKCPQSSPVSRWTRTTSPIFFPTRYFFYVMRLWVYCGRSNTNAAVTVADKKCLHTIPSVTKDIIINLFHPCTFLWPSTRILLTI